VNVPEESQSSAKKNPDERSNGCQSVLLGYHYKWFLDALSIAPYTNPKALMARCWGV